MRGLKNFLGSSQTSSSNTPALKANPNRYSVAAGDDDSPLSVLDNETKKEATDTTTLHMETDLGASGFIDKLSNSSKKFYNSNKQLISVGKHLASTTPDKAVGLQLAQGQESLTNWNEMLQVESKKLLPTYYNNAIKIWTVIKYLKIMRYTTQCASYMLAGLKSAAQLESDLLRQVAIVAKTLREAVTQVMAAWDVFPQALIPSLDIEGLRVSVKQIGAVASVIELSKSEGKTTVVTLKGTRLELVAACRAAAVATSRVIYTYTGKYTQTKISTTSLKVAASTTTQVLAVANNLIAILCTNEDSAALKAALQEVTRAVRETSEAFEDINADPIRMLAAAKLLESNPRLRHKHISADMQDNRGFMRSVSEPSVPTSDKLDKFAESMLTQTHPIVLHSSSQVMSSISAPPSPVSEHKPKSLPTPSNKSPTFTPPAKAQQQQPIPEPAPAPTPAANAAPATAANGLKGATEQDLAALDALLEDMNDLVASLDDQPKSAAAASTSSDSTTENESASAEPVLTSEAATTEAAPTPAPAPEPTPTFEPAAEPAVTAEPVATETAPTEAASTELPTEPTTNQPTTEPVIVQPEPTTETTPTTTDTDAEPTPTPVAATTTTEAAPEPELVSTPAADSDSATPVSTPSLADSGSTSAPASPVVTPDSPMVTPESAPAMTDASSDVPATAAPVKRSRLMKLPPPPPAPDTPAGKTCGVIIRPPLGPNSKPAPKPVEKPAEEVKLSPLVTLFQEDSIVCERGKKAIEALIVFLASFNGAIEQHMERLTKTDGRSNSMAAMDARPDLAALADPGQASAMIIKDFVASKSFTDSTKMIESGIPPPPPVAPAEEQVTSSGASDQEIQADTDIWVDWEDKEDVNVISGADSAKIRGGNLNKLVERLTSHSFHDLKYMKTFITTYRSFTTPEMLLRKLMQRFEVPSVEAANQLPIQLRVCNVLRHWVDNSIFDFNDELISTLINFIHTKLTSHKSYATIANSIMNTMREFSENTQKSTSSTTERTSYDSKIPLSPSRLLYVFDEEEIAKQLTLIDFSIYSSIEPVELLNQSWNKPKYRYRSPHVLALIARANLLANWAASVILWQERLKDRTKIFAKIISIAKHLLELNNFNSLVAILAGLNNSAVHRLNFTKAELPQQSKETFQMLEEVMNVNSAYKNYRALISNVNPPCVPFLGVYLTDLTFVEDGNPDFLKNGLINFGKRELVYNILQHIQDYQQTPYKHPLVDNIASFLDQLPCIHSENEMYDLSLLREPRNADKDSIL